MWIGTPAASSQAVAFISATSLIRRVRLERDGVHQDPLLKPGSQERVVSQHLPDEHGTKTIWVKAAAGDVIRFDATIDDLARALRILGDTDSLDRRRAKAIGWIADPAPAHRLLEAARL